jgi:hypothetical protein
MKKTRRIRLIEFLIIGILFGLTEDLLAIWLATDAVIDMSVIWIVLAVAVPFAFISEIIVDHPRFWEFFLPKHWHEDIHHKR